MIRINEDIALDESELEERFVRASGPGGQNVNKVSTAVQLRFDAAHTLALTETVRRKLLRLAGARATSSGHIVIMSDRFRSQSRNRVDALEKLTELILEAARPVKTRHATKPTRASKRRRLDDKKRHGDIKAGRRSKPGTD